MAPPSLVTESVPVAPRNCSRKLRPAALSAAALAPGGLRVADDLDPGDGAAAVYADDHEELSTVAGGGHFHHIAVRGFIYRLHQAGFVGKSGQRFSQLYPRLEDTGERLLRLLSLGRGNGTGGDGVHQGQKTCHHGGDEQQGHNGGTSACFALHWTASFRAVPNRWGRPTLSRRTTQAFMVKMA